jgi:transcriptional regulator with XRE-family HTH domain
MKGKELRTIRNKLGWTQVEMATALRVTANTVARWERDERAISEPMAKLIETVYTSEKTGSRRS